VNASGTGDLHVRVQLWTPQSVSPEHQALLQGLQTLEGNVPAGNTRSKGLWSKMKEALGA